VWGFVYCGTRWLDHAPENPVNQALVRWILEPWWWPSVVCFVLAVLGGTRRMVGLGGLWRLLALGSLAGALLSWGLASVQGNYLNLWYLFFLLPWLGCALALAVDAVGRKLPAWAVGVFLVVLLLPQGLVSWRFRGLPKQQERAPVELARGARFPEYLKLADGERALTAGFWTNAGLYDPQMEALGTVGQLDALVARARREGRPLFVAFSHRVLALRTMGDLVKRVEGSEDFALAGVYYGQEESQFTVHVYALR
jgi:hypothetical protein